MEAVNLTKDPIEFHVELLRILVYPTREAMGLAAATAVTQEMRRRLETADRVSMVLASAPSQSRRQQVNDGNFAHLQEVPEYAITLTIPALLLAASFSCIVPARSKAEAVYRTLVGPISPDCPGSFLRQHAGAVLYLDPYSAALIQDVAD